MDGLAIAASLVEVRRAAEGALVRSVHEPQPGVFLLGVFGTRQETILISPRHAAVYRTGLSFRNPERPSSFVMQLRKHLRNTRIRSIRQAGWERTLFVDVVRVESGTRTESRLVAELVGLRGNLLLLDETDAIIGSLRHDPRNPVGRPYTPVPAQTKHDPLGVAAEVLAELLAADAPARALARSVDGVGRQTAEDLVAMAAARGGAEDPACIRAALDVLVDCAVRPQPHVVPALRVATFYPPPLPVEESSRASSFGEALDRVSSWGDLGPAPGRAPAGVATPVADETRATRDRILAAIGRASRTERALRQWLAAADTAAELRRRADFLLLNAADLGRGTIGVSGEDPAGGERLAFALAPRLSGMENAQAFYKKARKLDRGRPTVEARLARIETDLVSLRGALQDIEAGQDMDPKAAALLAPRRRGAPTPAPSLPRRFEVDGHTILVGRSAVQNDDLMRRARPDDLWLHARDVAGSHVVIQRNSGVEVPESVLAEAARLAARYSKADRRGKVAVVYAEARHVRKPRRGAPGLAIVTNESTLTVEL